MYIKKYFNIDINHTKSDRATVDYHPNNDGLLIESVESLIDHGVLSGSGSAVSVLGLGETLLRKKDGAYIEVSLYYLFYHVSQTLSVSNDLHLKESCISLDQMIFISKNVLINY